MSINNKMMVLLNIFIQFTVLYLPILLLIYFEYYWLFAMSTMIFCIVEIKIFLSVRYIKMKFTSDKISVKEFQLFRATPSRFLKVATNDVLEVFIENSQNNISFHIELEKRAKVISFSTKHFTQNQKEKLADAFAMYIEKFTNV